MMATMEPTVSVVLRTFGHGPFIAQAIESVLIQETSFPFELVIGEDCSTDGTREIVVDYAQRRPAAIRAVLPERNIGHGAILQRALEATRGRYVAYLDGDDYWTSRTKLARQVEFLERHPDCTSCFHDVSLIHDTAGYPSGLLTPKFADDRFGLEDILQWCFVPAPAMMFRRSVLDALPAWSFESPWIDWLIHIRAAMLGWIGYLPQTLAAYRVHSGGMFSGLDRVTQLEYDLPVYERLLAELPERRELIEHCLADRHWQLTVERLAIPFDACVVLVDPWHELRPYFNGRHARSLPRRDARALTELEAIRSAAATLSTATPDYGQPARLSGGSGACYVVVPASAASWMEEHPSLAGYLAEHGQRVWADDWCAVHELPSLDAGYDRARTRSRVEVSVHRPLPDGFAGANVEAPAPDVPLPTYAVPVSGWALGSDSPIVGIELESGGDVLWRAPLGVERPDLAKPFPELGWQRSGFRTTFNALDVDGDDVEIVAVLANGERLPFAAMQLHRATA
jgi:hypothetical protein